MHINDGITIAQLVAKLTEIFAKKKRIAEHAKIAGDRLAKAKSLKAVAGAGALGGAVLGASGASIMSTLASAGAVIGGGVVAGIGLVAGGAGAGAAKLLNDYVYKNSKSAQIGSYTGAAAGTVGSLGTLATVGAGPSGLAAIGSVLGGGMAVGAITLLAAPVAGAALIGGAMYWRNQRNQKDQTRRSSGPRILSGILRMPDEISRKRSLRFWRR